MSDLKKWKLLSKKDISPSHWFPLFVHEVELPDGTIIDDYYISKVGDVAMTIAVTPNKEVIFVRQYKHGADKIVLELPAGYTDKDEPMEAAKRELKEETGIVAETLVPLGDFYMSPSRDPQILYSFLLTDAQITGEQQLDKTENIELVHIPINQIDEKIADGQICCSDTLAVIHLAKIKHPELFG